MIAYCKAHRIPVEASLKKPYSMDRNLLHISYEAGILEDPWFDPTTKANKGMFKLSVSPGDAPNKAEYVELDFVKGNCTVNSRKLTPAGVLKALNQLGGKHGIGRVDLVENRFVGMKSRGVYETPGTIICRPTGRVGQQALDPRGHAHPRFAHPEICGTRLLWILVRPEREALQALVDETQKYVTGTVRGSKLYKGNIMPAAAGRVFALRHEDRVDGGREELVQPERCDGFIRPERTAPPCAQPGAGRAEDLTREGDGLGTRWQSKRGFSSGHEILRPFRYEEPAAARHRPWCAQTFRFSFSSGSRLNPGFAFIFS